LHAALIAAVAVFEVLNLVEETGIERGQLLSSE
jgi:hypothetical protein